MTHNDDGPWWETLKTPEEWALISANEQMWCQPVPSEETVERLQAAHEMGLVVQGFMLASLTQRQQQVVTLYCLEGLTQVEVAASLGISQASVSQHLQGKLRGGHHVGGAFRKLRKAIQKAARRRAGEDTRHAQILSVFNELLDASITRRRASKIIGTLARNEMMDA